MSSKKRMDYDDLLLLYKFISLNYPAKKITQLLKKDRSTIYRIIISNSRIENERTYSIRFRNCEHLLKCKKDGINNCPITCPNFKKWLCPNLKKFPYICNFCENRFSCRKEKRLFNPEEAYISRMERFSKSKKCPKISYKELSNFDEIISPLIKEGLSIESIESSLKEYFPVTTRTVRNWINKGYLSAKRIDLRNAVKREYSSSYIYKRPSKVPLLKIGRTWTSFLKYTETEDKQDVIQFDTVHGKKNDKKCILTIHHPVTKFQIGLLLNTLSSDEVINKINALRLRMGEDYYFKYFRILLCDNRTEFDKMPTLEIDKETGEIHCRVFYTRPYQSGDKGHVKKIMNYLDMLSLKEKA